MKRPIAIAGLSAGLLAGAGAWAAEATVTLGVENMTCGLCPFTVRRSLEAVDGVSSVEVSLADRVAVVTYDDELTGVDALTAATTDAGFPSRPQE